MFEKFDKIENADLKKFSTMKVGGVAKYIIFPKNVLELCEAIQKTKDGNMSYFILGNGSNVLFDDGGFDGVIISLKHFNKIKKYKNCVWVGAGVNLFSLNLKLQKWGLSNLEWSFGIPATIGGMVVGNGGCFGHDMAEFVDAVIVFENGKLKNLKKKDLQFGYRKSNLKNRVVLSVKLRLKYEKSEKIKENMDFCIKKKRESQPCEFPSLGSIFKIVQSNPPIYPAKVIDDLGLKGLKINDAQVSLKHAGFIINTGHATSADVMQLIHILEKKLSQVGVFVEREIVIVGSHSN